MKRIFQSISLLTVVLMLFSCGISKSVHHKPVLESYNQEFPQVIKHSDTLVSSEDNYIIKNKQGLWELYVSGDALQRGRKTGALSQSLMQKQEAIFFSKVQEIVPSKFKQKLLRQFLKWYNRKLYLHVSEEYKAEIFGISEYASDDFNFIAPKYLRSLYLHGAHDIGHAMQDLAMVGCSAMAVWGDKSEDGQLLIGRNFDFYVGDEFAQEKIISFVKPEHGYPFMSVGWGGMIGVVSGMNLQGLTVTINAGKSEIPLVAKTPVSILAREILQYASNIDEAIAIAKSRSVFVSESIMIGSAKDKKAALLEVSPKKFDVYDMPNSNQLICSNHFQSDAYKNDVRNQQHILESHSQYRFDRMEELLSQNETINPMQMADILRNKDGLKEVKIGYGNEKALNQLLAHHGIIFQPERKMVWVSSNPYQLGEFVAYDLNEVFGKRDIGFSVLNSNFKNISRDGFLDSEAYKSYENYRIQDRIMDKILSGELKPKNNFIADYQKLNPEYWEVYYKTGKYYYNSGWYTAATIEFQKALTKEITTIPDRIQVSKYLAKSRKRQ